MLSVLAHRGFRRLWLSQVVSQLGDWLNRMAVLALIEELAGATEAAAALGLMFATELATRIGPTALVSPLAGPIADRLPRRRLMVAADLGRGLVVLGLCLVDEPADLPWLYGLVLAQMVIAPFFEAARSASVPNLVPSDRLTDAHALSSATWSTMLAFGSAAGGLVVTLVGTQGAFVLDAGTYLLSALLLLGLRLPPPPTHAAPLRAADIVLARDLRRAWEHARGLGLGPVLAVKASWGMAGGFLVLLSVLGARGYEGISTGAAIGLLYAARGVGTGLGPIVARRLVGDDDRAMARGVAVGFVVAAAGYACVPFTPSLLLACVAVVLAHTGGSTIWVFSTVLWQRRVDDAFRGRVHTLDFLAMTSAFLFWGFVAGGLYDATGSLAWAFLVPTCAAALAGPLWWLLAGRRLGQPDPSEGPSAPTPAR